MSTISQESLQKIFEKIIGYIHKELMCKVTIVQSEHQTITVTTGGVDAHTESFWAPKNTPFMALVTAEDGYVAGKITGNAGGTLYKDVTISAAAAVKILDDTGEVTLHSRTTFLTFPKNVHVIKVTAENPIGSGVGVDNTRGYVAGYIATWIKTTDGLKEGDSVTAYVGITPEKEYAVIKRVPDDGDIPIIKVSWSPEINQHKPDVEDYMTD